MTEEHSKYEHDSDVKRRNLWEEYKNITVSAQEMLTNDIQEVPMLWGHLLPKVGLALLSGDSDTGKSSLMRQFGSAIVTGQTSFLSYTLHQEHGSVVYVSTEDDYYSLSARFKMEAQSSTSFGMENLRYIFEYEEGSLHNCINEELLAQPADCVIVDALGDVISTDPNNIINVRKFYNDYQYISKRHNCLIIFVHHNRKSSRDNNPSKSDVSGSQALEAKPRAVLMLHEVSGTTNKRILRLVKGNYVPGRLKNQSLNLEINSNGMFCTNDDLSCYEKQENNHGFSEEAMLTKLKEKGYSMREIEKTLRDSGINTSKSTIARKLNNISGI